MNLFIAPREVAAHFNNLHPVGTPVLAYPGAPPSDFPDVEPLHTKTATPAWVMGGHTAVVAVDGLVGGISLMHIEIDTARDGAA